ncbi:hypothetical protein TSTA_119040 [Talaromyces stipitatus ATCC 10500]|uniref:DUF6606 domain-containing protein n=1 Tax=Talaromyces stipitatus (strain ATCC 10500 / CBS 375.48 / QM 6759 / NRRL 1006) TaxID=441959 RepID=B8M9Y8_TALSN|nr:uncharacterized protein TSTA_119040 [Talaromyces stipitatus ATCC 10500]EED18140.1 hypothetical protein TSTA_119040 [Talaromyces stipitatus ATCC 10500]
MPWRRSPLWLLIQVVLQLISQRLRAKLWVTEDFYKHFMVYYMSMILKDYIMTAKIAHRPRKLDLADAPAWFPAVQDTLKSANNAIQRAWNNIMFQNRLKIDLHRLKSIDKLHPTLKEYNACISMNIFESLVLPHQSQMDRLAQAEVYMKQRQSRVRYYGSGIFNDIGTSSYFPVRFFKQSQEHQNLLAAVEERARRERVAKHLELERKQQEYHDLYALFSGMGCTYNDYIIDMHFNIHESRHSPSCRKCVYEKQAESISIEVHEWSLSSNHLHAKSTVFELNKPPPFACGLSPFFTPIKGARRINLLLQNKPHLGTHRRDRKIINVTRNNVCLDNRMHFQYYDETACCFVVDFQTTNEMTVIPCTYQLPQLSSLLQQFLLQPANRSDGPPPNTVIASLHAYPEDMKLEEYRALCMMPLGIHIQWKYILRQLAIPSVIFKKVQTCIFLLQIINQAGPTGGSILRTGHTILKDDRFVAALLAEIKNSADRIKENWESVAIVREKADNTTEQQHRTNLMAQSVHVALIRVCMFDAERPSLAYRGYLEFRPAKEPWWLSDSHWKLKRCTQRGWCLVKDGIMLVSLRSETAKLISTILNPIERASKLHCKLDVLSSVLEIEIPYLRIGFTLQLGHSSIRSHQYPDMVIDADQSLETLVGLRNKLIMLQVNSHARVVLVPEGNVIWKKKSDHVAVEIGWQAVANLHAYSVDSQLGRLVDNGSLQSKLLLCYFFLCSRRPHLENGN